MALSLDIWLDASFGWTLLLKLWLLGWWSLLKVRFGGWTFAVSGGDANRERVGELKADKGFGGDLNLLAASDGVGSGADSTAGSGSDGCSLAAAQDAAEDCPNGCAAANLLCGVFAAALTLDAVGVSGDG